MLLLYGKARPHVIEIPPRGKNFTIHLALLIPWLVMACRPMEPRHQQQGNDVSQEYSGFKTKRVHKQLASCNTETPQLNLHSKTIAI